MLFLEAELESAHCKEVAVSGGSTVEKLQNLKQPSNFSPGFWVVSLEFLY